jgi:hypothetical protein
MAVHAVIRLAGLRRVIPFLVKMVRESEHMHRTKFNAVSTAFAPVFNNSHQSFRNVDLLGVQGLSPECHNCFLKRAEKVFPCGVLLLRVGGDGTASSKSNIDTKHQVKVKLKLINLKKKPRQCHGFYGSVSMWLAGLAGCLGVARGRSRSFCGEGCICGRWFLRRLLDSGRDNADHFAKMIF